MPNSNTAGNGIFRENLGKKNVLIKISTISTTIAKKKKRRRAKQKLVIQEAMFCQIVIS